MISTSELQSSTRNHQLKFVGVPSIISQTVHKIPSTMKKKDPMDKSLRNRDLLHGRLATSKNLASERNNHPNEPLMQLGTHQETFQQIYEDSQAIFNDLNPIQNERQNETEKELEYEGQNIKNIPLEQLPVKPVMTAAQVDQVVPALQVNHLEIQSSTPKEGSVSKDKQSVSTERFSMLNEESSIRIENLNTTKPTAVKTHFQRLVKDNRPTSVQSEDTVLYDDSADVYKFNLSLKKNTFEKTENGFPTKVLQIQTHFTRRESENEVIETPTSPDSTDKYIAQPKTLSINTQPLRKRSPTYYRNLLSNERPSDVSYLLDAELKDLTTNTKKSKQKLPPLNEKGKTTYKAKEAITFPSILEQVLKMVGQPVTLNLSPTKIPSEYHINEEFPIKNDQKKDAIFDQEKSVWVSQVFPSKIPASRVEVVHLARVFEEMLAEVKESTNVNSIDELSSVMDILDAVGMEIVRQVHVHCGERGVLLKIVLDTFQQTNKQSLFFYQKAKQILLHNKNETKSLMEKIGNLNTIISQKDAEINLYRNEIHELKMKMRTQNEQLKKLQKEKDLQSEELRKLQEIHLRRSRLNSNKHVQTNVDSQRMEFLENKAMNALNTEQARLEEKERVEREEIAAMQALREAQEALRLAELENAQLEAANMASILVKGTGTDQVNDKRLQTELTEVVESSSQTDPVSFQKRKKKFDKIMKYKTTPSRPKSPPIITQPSMIPIVQPLPLQNEFEVRENRIDELDDESDWFSANHNSESDVEDAKDYKNAKVIRSHPAGIATTKKKKNNFMKSRNITLDVASTKKPRKSFEKRNEKPKVSDTKMRSLASQDVFELFHDLIIKGKSSRIYSLKLVNRYILDILKELTDSDFLASTNDLRSIRKFVYDYHLVRYGLPSIAVQHLLDLLHSIKAHYKESSRARVFIQYCVLAQWYSKEQQDIYTLLTLPLYLKALQVTRSILNKKALKELEDGTLFVSETFVFSLLERLKLPLTHDEHRLFFDTVIQQFEDGYIYFDDLMILLIAAQHKHQEKRKESELNNQTNQKYQKSELTSIPVDEEDYPYMHSNEINLQDRTDAIENSNYTIQVEKVDEDPDNEDGGSSKKSIHPSIQTPLVSFESIENVICKYFGGLYQVFNDQQGGLYTIQLNDSTSKKDLIQVYMQAQKSIQEIINSFENIEVRSKFLETNSNLYRIVTELGYEEALTHYHNFICVLIREKRDPESLALSRTLITLFKDVSAQ